MLNFFWNKTEKRLRAFFRILVFLALTGALSTIVAFTVDELGELAEKSFTNSFVMIAMLTAIYISGKYIDKRPWSEFGITLIPLKDLLTGGLTGGILVLIIFAVQFSLGWLSIAEIQYNSLPTYPFIIVFVGQIIRYISGSVFEESFSRSYLLKNMAEGFVGKLSKKQSVLLAYLVTSIMFGLLHLQNDNATLLSVLNLSLLGLLFGWPVLKTGKLHFSIGLHAMWNLIQNNVFGAPNGGKKTVTSFFLLENNGDSLWTGGEFGPEGGLICSIVLSIALLGFIYPYLSGRKKFQQNVIN